MKKITYSSIRGLFPIPIGHLLGLSSPPAEVGGVAFRVAGAPLPADSASGTLANFQADRNPPLLLLPLRLSTDLEVNGS